jgi:hypothetical protein
MIIVWEDRWIPFIDLNEGREGLEEVGMDDR